MASTAEDIEKALKSLRVARLLVGFRGRPKAELSKIAAEIDTLCQAYLQERATIAEIEINPLFVYSDYVCVVAALSHHAGWTRVVRVTIRTPTYLLARTTKNVEKWLPQVRLA
mgnify:CR=1 FL=1